MQLGTNGQQPTQRIELIFLILVLLVLARDPLAAQPPITALAVSPDGKQLVVGSQAGLTLHSLPNLKKLRSVPTTLRQIHDARFHPQGRKLVIVGGTPSESGAIEVYSWPSLKRLRQVTRHEDVIYGVAWRGEGLATASLDRSCAFEFQGKPIRLEGHSRGATSVASLGKSYLLTASIDQSIRVWKMDDGQAKLVRTLDNHTQPIHGLAVRPSAEGLPWVVSAGQDRTIRFWQPTIGRMIRFRRLKTAVPLAVAWFDEQYVAVSCSDGSIRIVDSESGEVVRQLPGIRGWAHSISVHRASHLVVVGGENGRMAVARFDPRQKPQKSQ